MRAFYRVSGDVRIELPTDGSVRLEMTGGAFETTSRRLIVPRDEFEKLAEQIRDGDEVRAELRRSLDATEIELSETKSRLATLQEAYDAATEEREALRFLQHTKPARMVIHTTSEEKHDWTSSDMATADVLDKIAATAPVGSLVDDLKNTIVSQAREIARMKGESA